MAGASQQPTLTAITPEGTCFGDAAALQRTHGCCRMQGMHLAARGKPRAHVQEQGGKVQLLVHGQHGPLRWSVPEVVCAPLSVGRGI